MHCSKCHKKAVVKATYDDGQSVFRKHWCFRCGLEFVTVEAMAPADVRFIRPAPPIKRASAGRRPRKGEHYEPEQPRGWV